MSQRSNRRKKSGQKRRGPKKFRSGTYSYPAPIALPPTRSYTIQLSNLITVTSNVGGNISGYIPCDPSAILAAPFAAGAMFPEWTLIAQLFSAIKCVQLECHLSPASSDEVKGDTNIGVIIASNMTSISNFATSYTAISDNADRQTWNPILDQSGRGRYHALRHRPTLQWGGTSTPASSAAVYAGAVGGIGFFGTGAVSLLTFTVMVVGTYRLSQRS